MAKSFDAKFTKTYEKSSRHFDSAKGKPKPAAKGKPQLKTSAKIAPKTTGLTAALNFTAITPPAEWTDFTELTMHDIAVLKGVSIRTVKGWKQNKQLPEPCINTGRGGIVRWFWQDVRGWKIPAAKTSRPKRKTNKK